MADLVVDVDGLEALADCLEGIRNRLAGDRRALDTARDEVGSGEVWAALDHFERRWGDGRKKIQGNAKNLTEMLRSSAKAYRQTDQQLADDLQQSMSPDHGRAR